MLDQFKDVVEETPNKVMEFLEENMGQVGNSLEEEEEMGNFLEEGWGNLVEAYFSVDEVVARQVNVLPKHLKPHPIQSLTLCPRSSSASFSA